MFQRWQALVSSSALDRSMRTIRFTSTTNTPTTNEMVAQILELASVELGLDNAFIWQVLPEKSVEAPSSSVPLYLRAENLHKLLVKACADSNTLRAELNRAER